MASQLMMSIKPVKEGELKKKTIKGGPMAIFQKVGFSSVLSSVDQNLVIKVSIINSEQWAYYSRKSCRSSWCTPLIDSLLIQDKALNQCYECAKLGSDTLAPDAQCDGASQKYKYRLYKNTVSGDQWITCCKFSLSFFTEFLHLKSFLTVIY